MSYLSSRTRELKEWVRLNSVKTAKKLPFHGLFGHNQPITDYLRLITTFFFFRLLGPHLRRMEVPRLGVQLELQLPASTTATATATQDPSCVCELRHSSWQMRLGSCVAVALA